MTEAELRELQAVERVAQVREAILRELRKVIVGQTKSLSNSSSPYCQEGTACLSEFQGSQRPCWSAPLRGFWI